MLDELTIRKAVEFAVKTEELGGVFYEKMAKKFAGDPEIGQIFAKLAEDEHVHEEQFSKLLDVVPKDPQVSSQDTRMQVLRAMSMSEFFMGADGLYKNLDEITTREDALRRAFELEKATLSYYQAMRDVIGENSYLEAIIQAERAHVAKVMEFMITGAEVR
jgi:rubrerythrin